MEKTTKNPTYSTWHDMKRRCLNPTRDDFYLYGGRGIQVCDRWLEFENFVADMGERPEGKTLDRVDTNGNYEPNNCRWATPRQQARNSRRAKLTEETVKLIRGEINKTQSQIAKEYGISQQLVSRVLKYEVW